DRLADRVPDLELVERRGRDVEAQAAVRAPARVELDPWCLLELGDGVDVEEVGHDVDLTSLDGERLHRRGGDEAELDAAEVRVEPVVLVPLEHDALAGDEGPEPERTRAEGVARDT